LQQSQRITLRGLQVRSSSALSLTQSLVENKVPSVEPGCWPRPTSVLICFKLQSRRRSS
jgi:hypothetical protein